MKKIAQLIVIAGVVGAVALTGCSSTSSSDTSSSSTEEQSTAAEEITYTLTGSTEREETTGTSTETVTLELAADGTATLSYWTLDDDESIDSTDPLSVWTATSWEEADDGTVSVSFSTAPDDGGNIVVEAQNGTVESNVMLEDGDLVLELNSDGLLEADISIELEIVTYGFSQYVELTIVQE